MPEEREKKVNTVVTSNKATKKKQSAGKSFLQEFIAEDATSIKDYLIFDVIIPATKNAISDLITGGVDMLLFGSVGGRRTSSSSRGTNYSSISTGRSGQRVISSESTTRTQSPSRSRNNIYQYEDVYLGTRGEAEAVLSEAFSTLQKYDALSVADLYEICGMDSNYTDNKYGWTNLNGACVQRTNEGFLVKMPRVEVL